MSSSSFYSDSGVTTADADAVESSKNAAAQSAQDAQTHANTASTKASEASDSAIDAAASASTANNSNVQAVAANLGGTNTIGTVAGNIADINTVAGMESDVDTVANASYKAKVETVANAAYKSDVETVADSSYKSDVETVADATYKAKVETVADSTYKTAVEEVAADLTGSNLIGSARTNADRAAVSAGSALNSENNAASSESTAATHASNASTHATTASGHADDAEDAKTAAQAARDAAQGHRTQTGQDAAAAAASANSASSSASNAASSEANAAASEQSVQDNATAAAASASTASNNAQVAISEASDAADSASTASTASASAVAANTAAQAAKDDAEDAKDLAVAANTSAQIAKNSASDSASSAATSSSQASTAKGEAEAHMQMAALKADSARASSNASQAWSTLYQSLYLGAQSSAPSADLGGNALVEGALYFNSSNNTMYVYDGGQWVAAQSTINTTTTTNLTQDLNTNNFNIDLTDNDEIRFGNNDQMIMTGRSYGAEIELNNNNDKLFINANIDSDVNTASGRHFIKGFMVNNADEDGGILDPRIVNDLAGAHKWGNVTYTNMYTNTERTNLVASNSGAPFDPTSSHVTVYLPVGEEGTMEIDLNGQQFTYTSFVGVSFGNTGTRCERVKIEVYRNGSWLTIRDVTDNPHSMLCNYVNQGSQAITKIRYTFGDQVHSGGSGYFRLHTVFATNYQSGSVNGNKGVHYPMKYFDSQMSANTTWNDSYKARFGNSGDLQIHHTNGTSYIDDVGSGSLLLKSNSLRYQTDNSETRIISEEDHTEFKHEVWVEKTGGGNNTRLKLKGYDSNNYADIGTLTGGSGFGGLIEGGNNGQLTIGLRNNDVVDGFNIVSGGANPEYTDDLVYDKLAFRVQSNGNTTINGETIINDELKIRGGDATISNYNTEGGAARIEIGGTTTAYLDLKTPYGDDFDLRLLHEASTNLSQINSKSDLKVVVNGMEAMRFDSENGHVGIGATNPSKLLTLASNDQPTIRLTNLRNDTNWNNEPLLGALEFYTNDGSGAGPGVRASIKAKANNQYGHQTKLTFNTSTDTGNNIERMVIGWNGATTINGGSSTGTATLDVKDNTPIIRLTNNDTTLSGGNTIGAIQFKGSDQSEDGTDVLGGIYCISRDTSPDAYLSFRTHKNEASVDDVILERMRLTEEGKLRIGNTVSDPTYDLTITHQESSGTGTLGFNAGADNGHKIRYGGTGTNADVLKFVGVGDAERMRIDTSGNVLVGKTSSGSTIEGAELHNSGSIFAVRDSNPAGAFDRKTNDGDVVQFRRDGTTIGSVKAGSGNLSIVSAGSTFTFGNSGANIHFDSGAFRPFSADDNTIDLGNSSCRYKDIYLSGGVHLGGTGPANKLDDYEEGTWTPTLLGATSGSVGITVSQSAYTKIGNLVYLSAYLTGVQGSSHNAVGELRVANLPFNVAQLGSVNVSHCNVFSFDEGTDTVGGYMSGGNYFSLRKGSGKSAIVGSDILNSASTTSMILNAVYTTNY